MGRTYYKPTVKEKIKTTNLHRQTAKISALSFSGNVGKSEISTYEDILLEKELLEIAAASK